VVIHAIAEQRHADQNEERPRQDLHDGMPLEEGGGRGFV
jgi:hypothetical protein